MNSLHPPRAPARQPGARQPGARQPGARQISAALLMLVLLCSPAAAATYLVSVNTGVDDAARSGLSLGQEWKTATYAISRASDGAVHEIVLSPGEYSRASGETFPLWLPINVSLRGSGAGVTTIRNPAGTDFGTIRWTVLSGQVVTSAPSISNLSVVHDMVAGQPLGVGVNLRITDVTAAPRLTNLVITNAGVGVAMFADSYNSGCTMSAVVDRCLITGSVWGVLATAYTTAGSRAAMNPVFLNTITAQSLSDGMVFEAAASWDLSPGQRANATSEPVLTHCTITGSIGSAILLDNSNGYIRYRSGSISPSITNCILSGNGDFAVNEYTSSADPSVFNNNIVGDNSTALYYDEGLTEIQTIAGVPGNNNQNVTPLFVQGRNPTWHLRADSPGVDDAATGFATVDIDSSPRPVDTDRNGSVLPEIGADEAPPCAITAVIDPALPPDRCGVTGPLLFTATASGPSAGFTCAGSLTYAWYADGVPVGTDPTYLADPLQTTTYMVVVTCPDHPFCFDAASATVVVHLLPAVDASVGAGSSGEYEVCVAHDAADVTASLEGTAVAMDPGSTLTSTLWTSSAGVITGATALTPFVTVLNDGTNQAVQVTLTATDTNTCVAASTAMLRVWRGPRVLPMAPLITCQTPDSPQTAIPVSTGADVPAGSSIASWSWRSTVGSFDNPAAQNPNLTLINLPLSRTATLTVTATDDHGCTSEAQTTVTLNPSPNGVTPGGPYQLPEDGSGTTTFAICGDADTGAGNAFSWTTDLGVFQESGTSSATGQCVTLLVTNTGGDQTANVCVTVTSSNGCSSTRCTQASTRTSPIRPPNDVGGTFLINKLAPDARLRWQNAPLDATHDLAITYDVWESLARRPIALTWAQRAGAIRIAAGSGTTQLLDPGLLDLAGPDLIFLKIVSENSAGYSCLDPSALLPDCP